MRGMHGQADEDGREHDEDVGLDQRDDDFEDHDSDGDTDGGNRKDRHDD